MKRRFMQVDVFSATPIKGNGLAVVLDAEGMSEADMQAFAAWTNLAETTFLFPPREAEADYTIRIFSPGREMLFAGHPTLGSAAAWRRAGGVPKRAGTIVQDCAIGLVEIDLTGRVPAFVAPETKVQTLPQDRVAELADVLRLDPADILNAVELDNGPVWQLLELASAEAALAVDESRTRWPDYTGLSLLGAYPEGAECDYEVRNIAPSSGMSEDPITGSLNAAIAVWMHKTGRLSRDLVMSQGTKMGRDGRVFVRRDGRRVLIGGESHVLIEGVLDF